MRFLNLYGQFQQSFCYDNIPDNIFETSESVNLVKLDCLEVYLCRKHFSVQTSIARLCFLAYFSRLVNHFLKIFDKHVI